MEQLPGRSYWQWCPTSQKDLLEAEKKNAINNKSSNETRNGKHWK